LIARKLAPCPIKLCATPEFVEKHGAITRQTIFSVPSIVYNLHTQKNEWKFIDADGQTGAIKLNRAMAANTAEMELQACLQGVGVAVLPIFTAHRYLDSGELVDLFPNYQTYPERSIYAMYPKNRYLSTRTRLFIDWLSSDATHYPWSS